MAERRTGEALFARFFPNQGPDLSFFAPRGQDADGNTTLTETPGRTTSVAAWPRTTAGSTAWSSTSGAS